MEAVKCSVAKLNLFICINMNKTIQNIPYENLSPCRRVRWKLTHFFAQFYLLCSSCATIPFIIVLPSWKITKSRLTENKIPTLTVSKTCATCIFMLTESEQNSSCVNSLIAINSQQATYHQGQWADGNPCGQLEGSKKCHKKFQTMHTFWKVSHTLGETLIPSMKMPFLLTVQDFIL